MNIVSRDVAAMRTRRLKLLGSVAGVCLAVMANAATAQTTGEASSASQGGGLVFDQVERAPEIVIAGPGTPTTARDPVNVTGVGQMIVDQQNGFIGLCTATLINPRTVIFAAHCVNDRAANAYGSATGGQPIGFGFYSNNNAAGASAFGGWLNGVTPGGTKYLTNPSRFMFNANYVTYNPGSLEPAAASFLYSDIAMASLDTAARGVPTWALLFSALPAPTITAGGTGYHVVIDGYGNNGTGTSGSTGGIDYRRRLAENILGGLASLDHFQNFLFGGAASANPQNLYWIDFDDPRRGTPQASPFDFNAWRDNALAKEGITASGDSGGPLIIDTTFAKPVVIGVLSGGYTRFFNGQPANGYGTAAFYQPLYLYWDWIAANNPYHYVSATAGNGNWADATHWVTNLDPNYQIIGAGNQLVNGVPTSLGAGKTGNTGEFGQACFQSGGVSDCLDMSTNVEVIENKPIGTGGTTGLAIVSAGTLSGDTSADDSATIPADSLLTTAATDDSASASVESLLRSDHGESASRVELDNTNGGGASAQGNLAELALPAATLLNGLPGATNFTPSNTNGNRLTSTPPRYFDVTLSANGTTTLDTTVTIDRLTLAGVGSGLTITSAGSLTSNIDITQLTGTLQVDGAMITPGDYFMMTGGLSGRGVITTPVFTNMAGVIAPGTPGTTGALTFRGNFILASGGALLIDLGPGGVSDRIVVAATQFSGATPLNGQANVGGLLAFNVTAGTVLHYGDSFTLLTAEGGVSGTFLTPGPISAILTPRISYTATSVLMGIEAGLYADVVGDSAIQQSYAQLLDQNRVQYNSRTGLYGPLDMQSAANIRATLEGLAPRSETLKTALGTVALGAMSQFFRDRTAGGGDDRGGTVAFIGKPLQLASNTISAFGGQQIASDADDTMVVSDALPSNMNAYLAAGYVEGDSAAMPGSAPGTRDNFDGFFFAAGLETTFGDNRMLGLSLAYSDISGNTGGAPQTADGQLYQGVIYGRVKSDSGLIVNGQLSAGRFDVRTARLATVGPTTYTLRSKDEATAVTAELGVGYTAIDTDVTVTPAASLRLSRIGFSPVQETGGGPALTIDRGDFSTIETRLGFTVEGKAPTFKPYLTANYVHAFGDQPAAFGANFVGGVGPNAVFAVAGVDHDWGEVGAGLSAGNEMMQVSVAAETSVGRSDVESQSYRASVKFRF